MFRYWKRFILRRFQKKHHIKVVEKDYSKYLLLPDPSWRKERDEFLEEIKRQFDNYIKEYGEVPKTLYLDRLTYKEIYLRFAEEFKVDDIFPRDYFLWRLNVEVIDHPFISVGV